MEASQRKSPRSGYPGCEERDQRIAVLQRENAELRSRVEQLEQQNAQLQQQHAEGFAF